MLFWKRTATHSPITSGCKPRRENATAVHHISLFRFSVALETLKAISVRESPSEQQNCQTSQLSKRTLKTCIVLAVLLVAT